MKVESRTVLSLVVLLVVGLPACSGCLSGKSEVVGMVIDSSGPVAGVAVKGGAKEVETDADGIFRTKVRRGGDLLTFEREGYAPGYRPVSPGGADWASELVELAPRETIEVDPGDGTVVLTAGPFGEVSITIPEGAVDTKDPYEALVAYYPVYGGQQFPPVPLVGKEGKDLTPLESFGMLELTLMCGNKECDLARDATLTVRLPTVGGDPPTATLFTADPKEGIWIPEEEISNDGAAWTLPLTHLSWKNIDVFLKVPAAERACVRVLTRSPSGRPLPGVKILSGWASNLRRTIRGTTEDDGTLCDERFPSTESVTFQAIHFLRPGGRGLVTTSLQVTPTSIGGSCEEESCQEVVLTLACSDDTDCGADYRCASGECVEDRGPGTLKVTFRNEDTLENIHLWGPDEMIEKPNRVKPGKSERRTFEFAPGDTPLFHAGRDGSTLASLACLVVEIPNSKAELIWDGSALRCENF